MAKDKKLSLIHILEQFVNSFPSQEAHLTGEEIHKWLDEIEQIHELYSCLLYTSSCV